MVVEDSPYHPKVACLSPDAVDDTNQLLQPIKYLKSYQLPNGYQNLNNCLAVSGSIVHHHPKVNVSSLVGASLR